MSRKTVLKAIDVPEGAFTDERGQFGADPALSGFRFDIDVSFGATQT